MRGKISFVVVVCIVFAHTLFSQDPSSPIRINQVGYELNGPKKALYQWEDATPDPKTFDIVTTQGSSVYNGDIEYLGKVADWTIWEGEEVHCWLIDFSDFNEKGTYQVKVGSEKSFNFKIDENILFTETIEDLYDCFKVMRYTGQEDKSLPLFGSSQKVDCYGGYREASGDDSKHITHLSYANFMNTQENPGLTWGILRGYEMNKEVYDSINLTSTLLAEAAWGADYLVRSQNSAGWFYITVWNGWGTMERTVCAYEGYSLDDVHPTDDYQSAFREGGAISIAALAKASAMGVSGEYDADDYLAAAKKGYDHLSANNTSYCDDGKENIIDDYTVLVASIELYKATQEAKYKTEAGKRVDNLIGRQDSEGAFWCDDSKQRPYFHAGDEGYPIIALIYYMEIDNSKDAAILATIRKNVDWYFEITNDVTNPFNYVRQYQKPGKYGAYRQARTAFFIPQDNETGYWWQGENARLGSMASALLLAARALNPAYELGADSLSYLALSQLDWVLGRNPYEMCMLCGSGTINNRPYPDGQNFNGGVCNGITSEYDGGGIEWAPYWDWMDWRWLEQWLPHETWYMFAMSTLSALIHTDPVSIQKHPTKEVSKTGASVSIKKPGNANILVSPGSMQHTGLSLQIIDMKGRNIKSVQLPNGKETIVVNCSDIATGFYFLELHAGENCVLRNKYYLLR